MLNMPDIILRETEMKDRSEEVNELIDRMPTRFGFNLALVVLFIFISLFVFGWIIKYPDRLTGQLTITTRQAPVKLIAANAGHIRLFDSVGEYVHAGDYVSVIKNAADVKDVQFIDHLLKNIDVHKVNYLQDRHILPENVSVGELNAPYFTFLGNLYQYLDYYKQRPFDQQRDILEKSLASGHESLKDIMAEYSGLKNKYGLIRNSFQRDSILFAEHVTSASDLEKSHTYMIGGEQELQSLNIEITKTKYQIAETDNKLQQLVGQRFEKERELEVSLLNSYYEIEESIRQWERKYVFISPMDGKVEFLNFWKENDYISAGQEVFSIIPEKNSIIGQVFLPEQGAGKLKIGQRVIMKLDNSPYEQYGSLKGKVKSISVVTNQQAPQTNAQAKTNSYLVLVELPDGLITNYGSVLNFHFEAKGTAEINTEDRRLIERLFDNLRNVDKK